MAYVTFDDTFYFFEIEHGCLSWFPILLLLANKLFGSFSFFCLGLVCTTKKHFESAHLVQDGWLSLTLQHLNTLLDTGVITLVGGINQAAKGMVVFEGFPRKKVHCLGW